MQGLLDLSKSLKARFPPPCCTSFLFVERKSDLNVNGGVSASAWVVVKRQSVIDCTQILVSLTSAEGVPLQLTRQHTTSKPALKPQRHCFWVVKLLSGWNRVSFPERLKLQPTGYILMTNYILRCANEQSADCALILGNNRRVFQSCCCPYGRFHMPNKLPQYGGNNGDLSGTFQNGITL